MNIKWTYETCYQEALKYTAFKDFQKLSGGAYFAALRNKWLKNFTWLEKRRGPWTFEEIKKIINDNYILYSVDLEQKYPNVYAAACRNKWIKMLGLKHKYKTSKYTFEDAMKIALKYKYIKDFRAKNKSLYGVSVKNGWMDNFVWFERNLNPYVADRDCCYMYINEDKKIVYVGRTIHKEQRDYDHRTSHNSNVKKYFTKYGCEVPKPIYYMDCAQFPVEYGLMIEDKLVQWFKDNGWTVLNRAKTGIKCGAIGGIRKKWTKAKLDAAAEECNYDLTIFVNKYRSGYRAMRDMGYNPGFVLKKKPNGYWNNKERCEEAAKKCRNRGEFGQRYSMAYLHSKNNGWLEEFFPKK